MDPQTRNPAEDIDQLNAFLRDELSSVETYQQCLEKVDEPDVVSGLKDLQYSHEKRVELLRRRVQELGGTPQTDSGAWGSFSKMMEGGAKLFGDKAALSTLEKGEDRGKDNYTDKAESLAPENRSFIQTAIWPEHQKSHDSLSRMKSTLH